MGPTAYRRFTAALAALFEGLRLQVHPDRALGAVASRTIAVLPLLAVRIQQELQDAIAARGHRGLKTSHGPVLARIGPEGARIHEIARIQRVTRQAISAMSRELEELGYLRREADPRDGRGVLLRRTEHCTRLVRDSVAALAGLERSFLGIVGADGLAQLQRVARQLFEALHLEDELLHAAGARPAASTRPRAARGDMRALASSLRRRLDAPDVARLAALLEPRAKDAATRSGSAETSHRREASR